MRARGPDGPVRAESAPPATGRRLHAGGLVRGDQDGHGRDIAARAGRARPSAAHDGPARPRAGQAGHGPGRRTSSSDLRVRQRRDAAGRRVLEDTRRRRTRCGRPRISGWSVSGDRPPLLGGEVELVPPHPQQALAAEVGREVRARRRGSSAPAARRSAGAQLVGPVVAHQARVVGEAVLGQQRERGRASAPSRARGSRAARRPSEDERGQPVLDLARAARPRGSRCGLRWVCPWWPISCPAPAIARIASGWRSAVTPGT